MTLVRSEDFEFGKEPTMQQSISPKVAALLIAVVVLVAGIFGYKMLSKGKGSSGKPPPEAEKFLNPSSTMRPTGPNARTTGSDPSRFPGYPGGGGR